MSAAWVQLTEAERQEQADMIAECELSAIALRDYLAELIALRRVRAAVKRHIRRPHYRVAEALARIQPAPARPDHDQGLG